MGNMVPRITADKPFVFILYHVPTQNIVFEGILSEPKEVSSTATKQGPTETVKLQKRINVDEQNVPNVQPLYRGGQNPFRSIRWENQYQYQFRVEHDGYQRAL